MDVESVSFYASYLLFVMTPPHNSGWHRNGILFWMDHTFNELYFISQKVDSFSEFCMQLTNLIFLSLESSENGLQNHRTIPRVFFGPSP